MQRTFLKGKIHRAKVTQADLDYVGSITIDRDLIDSCGFMPYEKVEIYDITNGNRIATYVIPGESGSGVIGINGAAARLIERDDIVIIASYVQLEESEVAQHQVTTLLVDEENRVVKKITDTVGTAATAVH